MIIRGVAEISAVSESIKMISGKNIPKEQRSLADIVREELKTTSIEEFDVRQDSITLRMPRFANLPKFLSAPRFMKHELMHIYDSILHVYIEVHDERYLHLAGRIRDRLNSYGKEAKVEYKEK